MGSGLSRGVVRLAGGYLTTPRRRSTTISQAATGCGQVSPGRETNSQTRTWTGPCAKYAATTPHHLVSGRARLPGTQIFHARVKARPKEDGTHLRKRFLQTPGWVRSRVCPRLRQPFIVRGCSTGSMQRGARRHYAGRQITPQRYHQFARERYNGNAPNAALDLAHAARGTNASVRCRADEWSTAKRVRRRAHEPAGCRLC